MFKWIKDEQKRIDFERQCSEIKRFFESDIEEKKSGVQVDKSMTFTPKELKIIQEWGEFYTAELNNKPESELLYRRIKDHLDKIDEELENKQRNDLLDEIKASPMARMLLVQAYFFNLRVDLEMLTLHLRPEHKHLLTFQKELSDALKDYFDNDDFDVTVIVKHEKEEK